MVRPPARSSRAKRSGSEWLEKVTMFSSFQISQSRIGRYGRSGFSRQKVPFAP